MTSLYTYSALLRGQHQAPASRFYLEFGRFELAISWSATQFLLSSDWSPGEANTPTPDMKIGHAWAPFHRAAPCLHQGARIRSGPAWS